MYEHLTCDQCRPKIKNDYILLRSRPKMNQHNNNTS